MLQAKEAYAQEKFLRLEGNRGEGEGGSRREGGEKGFFKARGAWDGS